MIYAMNMQDYFKMENNWNVNEADDYFQLVKATAWKVGHIS